MCIRDRGVDTVFGYPGGAILNIYDALYKHSGEIKHILTCLLYTSIGIGDTNCDPEELDYIIPGNDDAIRAVKLIVSKMADAVIEAKQRCV